jgi:hypothetical protein
MGTFLFRLAFHTLKNDNGGVFGITNGDIAFALVSDDDGIHSTDTASSEITGTLSIRTPQATKLETVRSMTNFSLNAPKNSQPSF